MLGADKGQISPLDGRALRIGIVQARFNDGITRALADACLSELAALGVPVSVFIVASELLAQADLLSAGSVWVLAVAMAAGGIVALGIRRAVWLPGLRAPAVWRTWALRLPAVGRRRSRVVRAARGG